MRAALIRIWSFDFGFGGFDFGFGGLGFRAQGFSFGFLAFWSLGSHSMVIFT